MTRTALLAGATGLVGGLCLQRLLAHPAYGKVKVIARRPLGREDAKLEILHSDYGNLHSLGDALAADDVYCCLGTTIRKAGSKAAFERVDYHMVVDLARAAKKAGAQRFVVVSSMGASLRARFFYLRVKARMEQSVAEIGFEATHILRPSMLLGPRPEFRPAEKLSQWLAPWATPLFAGSLRKYAPIRAEEVAQAMVTLALSEVKGVQVHYLPL